jgi:predicted O-methyltransferase YrrM
MQAIDRLEQFQTTREDAWNIPRDEGLILHNIVLAGRCRMLVEVGTSYGFSGLFLASAAQATGGTLHTFDIDPRKHEHAGENFRAAGLADTVELHTGDARQGLGDLSDGIDFAFLDATKEQTGEYWQCIEPKLADSCILALDNISTHPDQLGSFVEMLRGREDFTSCPVAVGNGFELAVRLG